MLYFSAYLACVDRKPVFYGNHLKQLGLAYPLKNVSTGEVTTVTVLPASTTAAKADEYEPNYSGTWMPMLFQPAHWLDRNLRPNHWPVSNRRHC